MASNLCNLSFSWNNDRPPTGVTKFTYLDLTDANADLENGLELSGDERFAEDIESSNQTQILLTRHNSDEDSKHCIFQLTCPNPEFAQVNGISIVSESRTLEISSTDKGYLTTLRGKKVAESSQSSIQGLNTVNLYSCFYYFEESFPSLTIKFLSLGQRSSFFVQRIRINMLQHGLQSPRVNGTLDVGKLKKDIEDMGSTMSERAKDFMATLEQYEKNKMGKMNGILGSSLKSNSVGDNSNGLSSIMNSILGAGTMKSLSNPKVGSDGDKQDLFSILNSVCGSVANLRAPSVKQNTELCEATLSCDAETSNAMDTDAAQPSSHTLDLVNEKVERLRSDLKEELSEIRQEMFTKVEDVKSELNQKLDLVLNMLSALQPTKENT
ncbi:hypothetical protein EGW08_010844 [Elysia chlorotica]|uniref:Uncharacterized protein n=1 Tax=Elysia chlorotica TaxID=188477 RepID=A0A3S1BDF5_ELYCH|nr:hypothetical protein EGW08_010844 [Elysia chlorotica]